jgi:hypothetical protein
LATATLAELIRDCRSHLDEAVASFWDDEEMARWCWEAARDIARRTEFNQKTHTQNTVAEQQTYVLPEDMLRVFRVEYHRDSTYSYPLEIRDFHNMDDLWLSGRQVSGSQPYACAIWGAPGARSNGAATRQLYLFPTPSTSVTDGLILYYYAIPPKVDTNDFNRTVELPSGWEDLVPLYVEVVARRKESRDARWREAFELYEMRLAELMKTTRSWSDQQDTSIGGRGYGNLPAWLVGGEW